MSAVVTNLFGREDDWTEDEMARVLRHFEQGGSPRTIAAILHKPLERMETVFAALAAARERESRRVESPTDRDERVRKRILARWGPPLSDDLTSVSVRIRHGIIDEVNDYCRANPIQRREFIRRCLQLYLDWLDEDDEAEERFVRTYGTRLKDPRPWRMETLDLQGDEPFQMQLGMPRPLIEKLNDRSEKDNISRSALVDQALDWNLTMIAQDGEWVLFDDMVMARGAA